LTDAKVTDGQTAENDEGEPETSGEVDRNSSEQGDAGAEPEETSGEDSGEAIEVDPATVREQEKEGAISEAQGRVPSGYKLSPEGLFAVWTQNMQTARRRISDPVIVVAETHDADKSNRHIEVEFWLDDVSSRKLRLRRDKLAMGDSDLLRQLADAGLQFEATVHARNKLLEYLHKVFPPRGIVDYYKIGWQADETFCLPDYHSFYDREDFSFQGSTKTKAGFRSAGDYETWSREVAGLASGNPLLMFALCVAFSGPLLRNAGTDYPIFHFHGPTSTGKSTLAAAAASVWGDPFSPFGPKKTWLTTGNALEALASEHSDTLLVLDEAGVADPAVVVSSAFRVAGGVGKHRIGQDGSARDVREAHSAVISTGEKSFLEIAHESKKAIVPGMLARFIDINADAGAGLGVFKCLHGAEAGGAMIERLNRSARSNFGWAGGRFINLVVELRRRSSPLLAQERQVFRQEVGSDKLQSTERRVAAHFELVAAAGRMAAMCAAAPWSKEQALESVASVFMAWRESARQLGSLNGANAVYVTKPDPIAVARIDAFLSGVRELVPQYLPDAEVLRIDSRQGQIVHGWIERDKEPGIYVKHGFVASLFDSAAVRRSVFDRLVHDKVLLPGRTGELAFPRRQPGGKPVRVYRLSLSVLDLPGEMEAAPTENAGDVVRSLEDSVGELTT